MSDISVGKSGFSDNNNINEKSKKYSSIKSEYTKFKKFAEKSDMANSDAYIEKELEILARLKSAAQKEGKSDKVEEIDEKISQLLVKIVHPKKASKLPDVPFYKPIFQPQKQKETKTSPVDEEIVQVDIIEKEPLANAPENEEKTVVDENEQKILSFFQKDGDYHARKALKCCKNLDGSISPDIISAAANLSETGASANVFIEFIDNFVKSDDKNRKTIDLGLTEEFAALYNSGFNDVDSLKVLSFVQSNNFQSPAEIENYAAKLLRTGMSTNIIIDVLDKLKIKDKVSGKNKVLNSTMINVQLLKRALVRTRNNEIKEKSGSINVHGTKISKLDDTSVLVSKAGKDSKIVEQNPNLSVREIQKYINDKLSDEEDNIILKFIKKYKKDNGELDIIALRSITTLRRFGITNNEILKLTDYCIDNGKLNIEKLELISELKQSNAESKDIIELIEAIGTDENGNFDEENKKNALDLTSAVIGGKEVVSLLPLVRGKEKVKEFVLYLSQNIENRLHVVSLTSLIKKNDDTVDETAMEILYKLTDTFCDSTNSKIKPNDFVDAAEVIIRNSINPRTGVVDEEAAGICSILCKNGEPMKNVLEGIKMCKNQRGVIDTSLSELLWKLALEHASFDQISSIISHCKNRAGIVNKKAADSLVSMMTKKHTIELIEEKAKKIY